MKTQGRPVTVRICLTEEQRRELRQLAQEAVGRVSERAHFVLLSDQGKDVQEIAALMGYTAQTVYTWLHRYQRRGAAALGDEPHSGRPPRYPLLVLIVAAQACMSPLCYGYVQGCWTVRLLATHLRQHFHTAVGLATLRRALVCAEYAWGRAKLVLPKGRDPQEADKLRRLDEVLACPDATILSADECDMHLMPVIRGTWHPKGRQVEVPTPGQNKKRGVFGAVNLRTGQFLYHLVDRKRSVEFIAFLADLLVAYPAGPLYVLVDNCSIHTSKATLKWLQAHARVNLVYLPAYAGHKYNPIEKMWWALKGEIAANRCFRTLAELDKAIRRHFRKATPEGNLALINSLVVRKACTAGNGQPTMACENQLSMAA